MRTTRRKSATYLTQLMNQTVWLHSLPFALAMGGLLLTAADGAAHGNYSAVAPREQPGRPAPVVDGRCGSGEYVNAWRLINLIYRPRFNWPSARVNLLATATDLYIAVQGMPLHSGGAGSFFSVAFDVNHDAGSVADDDDLLFTIDETGLARVSRGDNRGGFIPAPEVMDWEAQRQVGDLDWSAEMRIPIALLGGGAPLSTVGLHIRQNWLRFVGDDYAWSPAAFWNVPNTWADLYWLGAPTGSSAVRIDQQRITQGLETDVRANVFYDYIAGKDTLVRCQLYTLGALRNVTRFTVECQRIAPDIGPVRPTPGGPRYTASLNGYPAGAFLGSGVFDAWIPGDLFDMPGTYSFLAQVELEGVPGVQTLNLGTKTFRGTKDLRLLLLPAENPFAMGFAPWNGAMRANVPTALLAVNRMLPLRRGVQLMETDPFRSPATVGGLRFFILPLQRCDSITTCSDDQMRALANDCLNRLNASMRNLDLLFPLVRPRERFDRASVCWGARGATQGQTQYGWSPPSIGLEFDSNPAGVTAAIVAHEIGHSLGQLRRSSPNLNVPSSMQDGGHSRNLFIPLLAGLPAVDLLGRQDIANPLSLMWPEVYTLPQRTFLEGFEWNNTRQVLESRTDLQPASLSRLVSSPLFHLVGQIDLADNVTVHYSQQIADVPLTPTTPAPNGAYHLVFFDSTGKELDILPFSVSFEGSDSETLPIVLAPLELTNPLPTGTERIEIRKGTKILWEITCSSLAPEISDVVAIPNGSNRIDLTWTATDADTASLTCNIFYQARSNSVPLLIASGLRETHFSFFTEMIAATPEGVLIVEASDGCNTASAASAPFPVGPSPPVVAISPITLEIVAGQPVLLNGIGFEATDGVLGGSSLEWSANGTFFGLGEHLETSFPAGIHSLSLEAKASSGLAGLAVLTINALADSDQDSLPDTYENAHECLQQDSADANADPDEDGLSTALERILGTNPCELDTDGDGFSDGDEQKVGSDPILLQSVPSPNEIFLSADPIVLWPCVATQTIVSVQTLTTSVVWQAASDVDWLTITGGGQGDGIVTISANTAALPPGRHTGQILISAEGGQPRMLPVELFLRQDTNPPAIMCPSNIIAVAASSNGAPVSFAVDVTDAADPAPILTCMPQSGSMFPVGTTGVTCSAVDACGNASQCVFPITVQTSQGRPALAIRRDGNEIVISWPASFTDYATETTTRPEDSQSWTGWQEPVIVDGDQHTTTVPQPNAPLRFFRLIRKQP